MSNATPVREVYISEDEVEQRLGINKRTLQTWRLQRRNLPFHKFGKLVRYRASDVEAFAEKNLVTVDAE